MKKTLYSFLLTALLGLASSAQAAAYITGMPAGVAVGSSPTSGTVTYQRLTGVAQSYEYIGFNALSNGDYFAFSNVSIATGAYRGTMTGGTNTAALISPAVANVSITAQWTAPQNYGGGLELQAKVHYSANTTTANWTTITADAYVLPATGLTTTVRTAGTAVNPATTSGQLPAWLTLTNAIGSGVVAGDKINWKLDVDSGNDATRIEFLDFRVRYYPIGVQK